MAQKDMPASGWSTPRITPEMIKCFNGEGDLVAWLAKAKLVARLARVDDLANFLPLYLEGDALALYLEMSDGDQASAKKIEEKLKEAFTDGPCAAYSKLMKVRWNGEPVDVYATEIRRLVGLTGLTGDGLDLVSKLAFINGFPEDVRVELQQVDGIEGLKVSDILGRARIIVGNKNENIGAVSVSSRNSQPKYRSNRKGRNEDSGDFSTKNPSSFRGKCFVCEGPHMARDCPEKKAVKCYKCGKEGHLSYTCESEN